jgi:ankyrin repeat protein
MQALNQTFKNSGISLMLLLSLLILMSGCINSENNSSGKTVKVETPKVDIHTAVVLGDIKTIKQHIDAGSDLNTIEQTGGSTALITAIVLGKNEIALALIEGGADVNISNNDGSTPIYCAAFFGRTALVIPLLEKGADKEIRNNFGSTALEAVSVPFETIKGIYDQISRDMGPLGLKLDYKELEASRPVIAKLLSEN